MAIPSKGWYGVPEGLVFSFPVTVENGVATVVEGWELDDFGRAKIQENVDALVGERSAVSELL